MVSIARRNLFQERTRLLISVGGVAFSVMLVLILAGLYGGWRVRVTAYIDRVQADLWVAQDGASDMFHSGSFLPAGIEGRLRRVRGVRAVYRYVGRQVTFDLNDREANLFLVGFDPDTNVSGPVSMVAGKDRPGPGEIIVDRVFARNKGLVIGDVLEISETPLRVVGISDGGNMVIYQFAFVDLQEAERLLQMDGFANFFLVQVERLDALDDIKARIGRRVPGIEVFTRPAFKDNNARIVTETFLPIIAVLTLIALAVGAAVIGLTIYTATVEKSREYGVLKAIGASNTTLYRIVLQQAVSAGALGYLGGGAVSLLLARVIQERVPAFMVSITGALLAWMLLAVLLMSAVAAIIPAQRIARIDPAEAFRA